MAPRYGRVDHADSELNIVRDRYSLLQARIYVSLERHDNLSHLTFQAIQDGFYVG